MIGNDRLLPRPVRVDDIDSFATVFGDPEVMRTNRCQDRKSTRLNSSHVAISYAVSCLKKKRQGINEQARRVHQCVMREMYRHQNYDTLSFTLKCNATLRLRQSFPTRRSSDLLG